MIWLGLVIGFFIGANLGVFGMALFKHHKN